MLNFSDALNLAKGGERVARASWKDSIKLKVESNQILAVSPPAEPEGGETTAPWSPTQDDLMANDWDLARSLADS